MNDREYRAEQIAAIAREIERLDLVNVVRCRYCKWCIENDSFYDCEHFACHLYWNEGKEPDAFCAWGERKRMTNFIKAKIYTLERKQVDVFTNEYEYSIAVHDGYRFYVLDDKTGELVSVGMFKVHDKLFAIVDMQTGLVISTSHYRSDSKESAVEHFKKNYKAQFLKARHNDKLYSMQKMLFEGVKNK